MTIEDIHKVLIIGAGNMGQQIGFQCAISGYEVVLYDVKDEFLEKAMIRINKLCRRFVSAQQLTEDAAAAALARIKTSSEVEEAGRDIDFVSESVPEDPQLKGEVFAGFNKICPDHAVFTTNTSSLIPSLFAEATGRPQKFAALHFHDVRVTNNRLSSRPCPSPRCP